MRLATVARLPVYLRSRLEVAETKAPTISSERLAELAGVNAAKVRKDLSYLGSYGTRGVGYEENLVVRTDSVTLVDLHLRHTSYAEALRSGLLELDGPPVLTRRFGSWFRTSPFAEFEPA